MSRCLLRAPLRLVQSEGPRRQENWSGGLCLQESGTLAGSTPNDKGLCYPTQAVRKQNSMAQQCPSVSSVSVAAAVPGVTCRSTMSSEERVILISEENLSQEPFHSHSARRHWQRLDPTPSPGQPLPGECQRSAWLPPTGGTLQEAEPGNPGRALPMRKSRHR